MRPTTLGRDEILEMAAGFQEACILGAAAELDVFAVLGDGDDDAGGLAARLRADLRALTILLDALVALRLLEKTDGRYRVPEPLRPLLRGDGPETVLPMVLHRMVILRGWAQLAWTAKGGIPAPRTASIRGAEADTAAFIAAMHTASGPSADALVGQLAEVPGTHLLDVGGASGTWTLAFLRARPDARATIFDRPHAIDQARERLAGTPFADRVALVAGDFYADPLPPGADLAWVSAIVHQHDRAASRELFGKVLAALVPGGRIALRDIVMEPDRTAPPAGALFAVNMLVNTERGGTFTFAELAEDLQAAGFRDPEWVVRDPAMNSVVVARRP